MMVDGVGNSQVRVTQKADHPLFGTCWYYPQNEFNIISQHRANEAGWLVRLSDDNKLLWLEREKDWSIIYFTKNPKDKFFKCQAAELHKLIDNDKKIVANEQSVKVNVQRAVPLPGNLEEIYGQGKERML